MDVLVVNHRDPRHPAAGGAETTLFEVFRRLVGFGVDVCWLSERFPGSSREEELGGILVERFGGPGSLHLYAPLEAARHELVVDSVAHAAPFLSFLACRRTLALVHHVHQDVLGLELDGLRAAALRGLEKMVRFYPRLISVSNTTKRDLVGRIGVAPEKVEVIYNGVDHAFYRPGRKDDEPLVLWIGRLKRYKNPLDAAKIYSLLSREVRGRARLVVAGGGELEAEVRRAVEAVGGLYVGHVSASEKLSLYQRAWVVLSTSFVEGWGMTVVEANACDTPAVAYATGSLPEVIRQGVNGYTVPYKDYVGAARLVEHILTMGEEDREALFRSSHNESLKYGWDKAAREYYMALKSL